MSEGNGEILLSVRYIGPPGSRFDRDIYVNDHVPMVMAAWGQYGLLGATTLFPAADDSDVLAVCECRFRDRAALDAAFASPETPSIMAHIAAFTDIAPSRLEMIPLAMG